MFDRLASVASFFRLIVAHLECPDMSSVYTFLRRYVVEPGLADQLRVEGCHEQVALLQHDRVRPRARPARARSRTDVLDPRRADEHAAHRVVDALDVEVRLERIHLPPVGVALHRDVDQRRTAARRPRRAAASTIMPAHVPRIGMPAAARSRTGSTRSYRRARAWPWWWTPRRGSPGSRRRRGPRRVRTSTGVAPAAASTRACSRKSPWSARTPAFTGVASAYQPRSWSRPSSPT